jgi:hypothetical protein
MKYAKIPFLALTALLVMSFTIASQNHWWAAPKKPAPFMIYNCYNPTIRVLNLSCTNFLLSCNRSLVGAPVFSKSSFSDSIVCDDAGNTFCCAQLDVGAKLCNSNQLMATVGNPIKNAAGTVLTSGWVYVTAIYCKLP